VAYSDARAATSAALLVIQARGLHHRPDVAQLVDQVALEAAGSGRGVEIRAAGHRRLDIALQAVEHSPGTDVARVRVEHRGDDLQIDLRRRRVLMRQRFPRF
jgi:maltoporin